MTARSIGLLLIAFFVSRGVKAQKPVDIEIRQSSVNEQIISHILKVTNRSEQSFNGSVRIDLPSGIRTLSRDEPEISVAPGDSCFAAYKLLVGGNVGAGRKTVRYDVYNEKREKVLSREAYIDIAHREQLFLLGDDSPVMAINPEDSVRIAVTVNNSGNTYEEVTVVFNIPNLRGQPPFTELKETVAPMEQKQFTLSFIPSNNLLRSEQFTVQVTAMKGKERTIFGSKAVTVQNVFTDRNFIDTNPAHILYSGQGSDGNSITLSYRQYDSSSNMMQLQGGGYLNLPTGYLHLKGNIYQYSSQRTPMVTNTSLMYKLYENEFTIGNVNEQTELPLYGRGAKAMFSDGEKNKTLTVGAVDQNFDLVGPEPWFSDYYSFYALGALGVNNMHKGVKTIYIYQKNPYERAIYNMGGLQWRVPLGKNWDIQLAAHGALSSYENVPGNKFSGSAEFRYRGDLPSGPVLSGSGYYSDGYFPGSRKGTSSFTQEISSKLFKNFYLSGSAGYNRTEPKSYAYHYTYRSENSYGNVTLILPKLGRVSSSLYYRYQGESSPSYASYHDGESAPGNVRMASHRIGGMLRWQSPNMKHSLFGSLEGDAFNNPLGNGRPRQVKTTLSYSWQWLTAEASYQKGAYYLYEYMMGRQLNKEFYRLTSSVAVNKKISKKFSLSSNVNFTRDVYQGNVPSINLNANYTPKDDLSFFLNAYWYQYQFINTSNIFNVEAGVTWNFSKTQPLSGRKSTVIAQVYYDHNGNNRYDKGDEPADGYLLNLEDKAFISGSDGKVRYSLVPYGEYTLKPMQAGSWFFNRRNIAVNSAKTKIDIPLKQSGTLRGSISYMGGEQAVEIVPRYEGLRFTVANADKTVAQTLVTDAEGKFHTFLPVGEYTITLDRKTLAEQTDCKDPVRTFRIEAGKVNKLEPFTIEIRTRKVNVKKFFAE